MIDNFDQDSGIHKIFLVMFNMYFFYLLMGMQVNFRLAFHPIPILDFADMFPIKAAATRRGKYSAKESKLDY